MKAIAAVLSCGLALSMVGTPALADPSFQAVEGVEPPAQTGEGHDGSRPGTAGAPNPVRRALEPEDLAAALALLFFGQVPKGAQPGMAVQLTLK